MRRFNEYGLQQCPRCGAPSQEVGPGDYAFIPQDWPDSLFEHLAAVFQSQVYDTKWTDLSITDRHDRIRAMSLTVVALARTTRKRTIGVPPQVLLRDALEEIHGNPHTTLERARSIAQMALESTDGEEF